MVSLSELEIINPSVPDLNKRILYYMEYYFKREYKRCIDYTYPGLLDKIPKKKMLAVMKKVFNNKDIIFNTDLVSFDNFSRIVETNEGSYCRIDYTILMALQFTKDLDPNNDLTRKRKDSKKEFMLSIFKAQYGDDNMWHDEITNSYCFHVTNRILAIKDEISPEWTFMMFTEHPMIESLIPRSVFIILND